MRGGPTAATRCASSWWRPGWPGLSAAAQLVRGVVAQMRQGAVGVPVGASVIDRLAARIALGILALSSVGAPLALASAADAEPSSSAHAAAATHQIDAAPSGAQRAALRSRIPPISCGPARRSGASPTRDQATGRTGPRSPRLNLGTQMPGGVRFVDPDHVRAGWRLRLPPDSCAIAPHAGDSAARQRSPAGTHGIGTGIRRLCGVGEASQASQGDEPTLRCSMADRSRRGGRRRAPRSLRGRTHARSLRGGEPHARPCGARSGRRGDEDPSRVRGSDGGRVRPRCAGPGGTGGLRRIARRDPIGWSRTPGSMRRSPSIRPCPSPSRSAPTTTGPGS